MTFKTAAVKRVTRPEKQLLYLLVGRFLKQDHEYDVALDLACGRMPLAGKIRAKRYIGIDLNGESLRKGLAKYPTATALQSTIENMNEDISGDIVLCFQCIGVNKNFQTQNTVDCVRRMVSATRSGGTLLFNVGPLSSSYFGTIEAILGRAFGRVKVIQYGRFYQRRSKAAALVLAYAMSWLPFLAKDKARGNRLYICQDRKPHMSDEVTLAA